jgi:Uma2 family endonuclease
MAMATEPEVVTSDAGVRRFTVDDYTKMGEFGILNPDERVELVDGVVITMSPIGDPHESCVDALTNLLVRALGARMHLSVQNPIRLDDYSAPQPDITVSTPREDFYRRRRSTPDDVLLLIEVMDTSHRVDRRVKLPRYARAGIPEVWLVDLKAFVIEVYKNPQNGEYSSPACRRPGEMIAPEAFPDVSLPVSTILDQDAT